MQTALNTRFAPTLPTTGRPRPRNIFARIKLWMDIRAERRALARLDQRLLNDIGIDEAVARHESMRQVWDVPVERERDARIAMNRWPIG